MNWSSPVLTLVPISKGGTGQTTAQTAINALTQVAAATVDHVLTKGSGGNAEWKVAPGAGTGSKWTDAGTFTYLTDVNEDLVIGSNVVTGGFLFDISESCLRFNQSAGKLQAGDNASDSLVIQAYDTDTGPAYVTFITLTSGTTPTCNLESTVTLAGVTILSASNTVTVTNKTINGANNTLTIITSNITDDAVTYAKIQNVSQTDVFLGRDTAGAGNVEEITMSAARAMLNVADGANNYVHPNHTGDVTSVGDGATTIVNNAVTTAKILDDAVTYAKIQNITSSRILGRITAGTGIIEELTSAQVKTFIGAISLTTDVTGVLPIANGGTSQTTAQAAINILSNVAAASLNQALIKDGSGNAVYKIAEVVFDTDPELGGHLDTNDFNIITKPGTTNPGLILGGFASNPSVATSGSMYYNTVLEKIQISQRGFYRDLDYEVTPEEFGATGGADDSVAFQNALNAIDTAGGGVLRLKANRTYIIDQTTIGSNTWIRGQGFTSVIKFKASAPDLTYCLRADSESNIILSDFKLDGNEQNHPTGNHSAFRTTDCDFVIVRNLYVTNGCDRAIDIRASSFVWIHDNIFINNGYAVPTLNAGNAVSIDVNGLNFCTDIFIQDNYFETFGDAAIGAPSTSRLVITGNVIRGATDVGLTPNNLESGIGFQGSSDVVCNDNVIRKCKIHGIGGGEKSQGSASFTVDTGTDIFTSNAHGQANNQPVFIDSTVTTPSPLVEGTAYFMRDVTTNTFKLSATPGGTAINITTTGSGTLTWIKIYPFRNVTIIGNTLVNSLNLNTRIEVDATTLPAVGSYNVTINGNTIDWTDCTSTGGSPIAVGGKALTVISVCSNSIHVDAKTSSQVAIKFNTGSGGTNSPDVFIIDGNCIENFARGVELQTNVGSTGHVGFNPCKNVDIPFNNQSTNYKHVIRLHGANNVDPTAITNQASFYSKAVGSRIQAFAANDNNSRITQLTGHNYTATTDPTVNDDSNDGFFVGADWINTVSKRSFICADATIGAAVWNATSESLWVISAGVLKPINNQDIALDSNSRWYMTVDGVVTHDANITTAGTIIYRMATDDQQLHFINDYSIDTVIGVGIVSRNAADSDKHPLHLEGRGSSITLGLHTLMMRTSLLERGRIDSSGNLLWGTTTSPTGTTGKVHVFGDNVNNPIPGSNTAVLFAKDDGGGTVRLHGVDEGGSPYQLSGYWVLNGIILSPNNSTYDLAIGGTTSSAPVFIDTSASSLKVQGSSPIIYVDANGGAGSFGAVNISAGSKELTLSIEDVSPAATIVAFQTNLTLSGGVSAVSDITLTETGVSIEYGTSPPESKLRVGGAIQVHRQQNPFGTTSIYPCLMLGNRNEDSAVVVGGRSNGSNVPFFVLAYFDTTTERSIALGGSGYNVPDANAIYFATAPTYNETTNQAITRMTIRPNGRISVGATVDTPNATVEIRPPLATDPGMRVKANAADHNAEYYVAAYESGQDWFEVEALLDHLPTIRLKDWDGAAPVEFRIRSDGPNDKAMIGTETNDNLEIRTNAVEVGRFDRDTTSGNSRFWLYDAGAGTLKRVKIGAAGTGPSGVGKALFVDS